MNHSHTQCLCHKKKRKKDKHTVHNNDTLAGYDWTDYMQTKQWPWTCWSFIWKPKLWSIEDVKNRFFHDWIGARLASCSSHRICIHPIPYPRLYFYLAKYHDSHAYMGIQAGRQTEVENFRLFFSAEFKGATTGLATCPSHEMDTP